MKSLLIAILIAAIACSAKAQSSLTPRQYNDRISAITDSLSMRGQGWADAFRVAVQIKDFSILKQSREGMLRFIDASAASLKAMGNVSNSKLYSDAMSGYLAFERSLVAEGFASMETLTATSTEEEIKSKMEQLKTSAAGEPIALQKVIAAQEAYAKENGFTIEQ